MHLSGVAMGAVALLCAGCGMFPASTRQSHTLLPPGDAELSRSLAHFSHGLILEEELGARGGEAALDAFRQATALNPTNPLLSELVIGRLWAGGAGEEALSEALRRNRRDPCQENYALIGGMAETLGKNGLAARHYAQAAGYGGAGSRQWRMLEVRAWVRDGNDRRALRTLQRESLPKSAGGADFSLPYFWGQQLLSLDVNGSTDKPGARARPYFELALRCATNGQQRAVSYEGLARTELAAGNTNAARRLVGRAVQQSPGDPDRILNMVRLEIAVEGAGVTNAWAASSAASPPDPDAAAALALLAAGRGDFAAASRLAATARRGYDAAGIAPLSENFFSQHAFFLEEAGAAAEAEARLIEALEILPGSAQLQNHLAYFWSEQNRRLGEAESLVGRALAADPGNGAYLDTQGWIYYRQGRYDEALAALLRAIERIEGGDATVYDHTGDVYLALGRHGEALLFWRRALRLRPDAEKIAEKVRLHADGGTAP